MEFIELSKENYKDYLPLDIAAFSFAFAGAMGDAGGVVIITTSGQLYYFNYAYQDFSGDDVDAMSYPEKSRHIINTKCIYFYEKEERIYRSRARANCKRVSNR